MTSSTKPASDSEGLSSLFTTDPLSPAGRRYALCIGIDHYKPDSGYPVLQCAVADAKSLGAIFAALGYRTTVMTDDDTRGDPMLEPTAANIKRELIEFARQATNPDDELVISYAGHGDVIDKQAAIVPIDYSSKAHNLVTVASILGPLNDPQCHAGYKLLLLDACHSGSVDKGFIPEFSHEKSLIVFSACSTKQSSMEVAAKDPKQGPGHGRFTEAIMLGLVGSNFSPPTTRPSGEPVIAHWDGEAYAGQSEFLTATQLSVFVGNTFRDNGWAGNIKAGDNPVGQNPQMFSHQDVTSPMILARRQVTVRPPPLTAEDLETIKDTLLKGLSAYASHDWMVMINRATTVLRIEDHNADALALRSLGNLHATYVDKADEDAQAALQSDPNQALALRVRGICEAGKKDKPRAVHFLKAANRLIDADPVKWHLLATGAEAAYGALALGLVTPDGQEAIDSLTKAAASPDLPPDIRGDVALLIGQKYENGSDIPRGDAGAIKPSKQGVDEGNPTAIPASDVLNGNGRGDPRDRYAKAMSWYHTSAELGNAEAMTHMGHLFQMGLGIPQDFTKALQLYNEAVDKFGNADAMNWIGFMHEHGQGFPKADVDEAMKCYLMAADGKSAMAMNNIGSLYFYGLGRERRVDYDQAMFWYRKGADLGSKEAMCQIGYLYEKGYVGDHQSNYPQAQFWYQKAINAGSAVAMFNLGNMYCMGQVGKYNDGHDDRVNFGEALKLYCEAEDAGYSSASDQIDKIGVLYEDGNQVEKSCKKAMECFRKAADANNARAMYHMAVLYENGCGGTTAKDTEQARSWYQKAAARGDDDANKWLAAKRGNRGN